MSSSTKASTAGGLAEKLSALAQQAARLRIDAVNIVEAGFIEAGARKIVDERVWD